MSGLLAKSINCTKQNVEKIGEIVHDKDRSSSLALKFREVDLTTLPCEQLTHQRTT